MIETNRCYCKLAVIWEVKIQNIIGQRQLTLFQTSRQNSSFDIWPEFNL